MLEDVAGYAVDPVLTKMKKTAANNTQAPLARISGFKDACLKVSHGYLIKIADSRYL